MKKKKELAWLLRCAKPEALGVAVLSAGCCVTAGISVGYALVMKVLVDSAVQKAVPEFIRAALLYLLLLVAQMVLVTTVNLIEEKLWFRMDKRLQSSLFESLLRMEHRRFLTYHTGTLMSHITTDVETVVTGMLELLPGFLSMLVTLAGTAVILILWDRRFAIVLLVCGGAVMFSAALMRRKMKQLQRDVREENDKIWSFLDESLRSMTILKAFCAQKLMQSRLAERMEHLRRVRFRQAVVSNLCNRGFSFSINGGYLLGLVWCCNGLLHGTISYGMLTAVLQLVSRIQYPFSQISGYLPRYYAMCASAERLMALEAEPSETESALERSAEECEALYRQMESICAERLCFSYGEKNIYTDASLCIQKGETVAFMGESGIGKSTFLKLLLALYPPAAGSIWLEDTTGHRTPVSVDTRGLFAYVPQQNALLSGSIWECVTFFREGETLSEEEKARVQQACRTACAEEFILALPKGYDTVLGEGGKGLSEGQMQRLAVARALYADTPILLLDEATSALDEATEARLLANLQKSSEGKTIFIVTHRRAALALCDRVFEVEQGQFRERKESV